MIKKTNCPFGRTDGQLMILVLSRPGRPAFSFSDFTDYSSGIMVTSTWWPLFSRTFFRNWLTFWAFMPSTTFL